MTKFYPFRYIATLLFVFVFSLTIQAQPKWGSEWKIFQQEFIFDGEYHDDLELKSSNIRAVSVDPNGPVYFAVGGKIKMYADGKLKTLKNKSYGTPRYVNALEIDSKHNLWIGTDKGLFQYDGKTFAYVSVPGIRNITEIAINDKDHIYIAGYSSNAINATGGGLSVFDGNTWVNYNKKNSDLPRKYVEDITFDKDGNVWMAIGYQDFGITKFDGNNWTFYNTNNSPLSTNVIRAIAFDSKGNAWFGTPKGLIKFDGNDTWTTISLKELILGTTFSNLNKYLSEPDLISITIDANDVLWIGTEGDGVIRIQGDGRTVINMDNSPITSDHIRDIYLDHENRKWFITGFYPENWSDRFFKDLDDNANSFAGVVMYQDPNYEHFKDWKIMNTFTSDQPGNYFTEMQVSDNGEMWLASSGFGTIKYANDQWTVYQDPDRGLVGELISCIGMNDKEIYAGAQLNGLYKVEGEVLSKKSKESFGYSNKNLIDVEMDNEGNVWIAHIMGVEKCKDGTCTKYNKKNGLLSSNVFGIRKDSKGRIWVLTTKGASIYDKGTWTSYTKKANGLQGYVYDVIEDKDGTFWAGTGKGLFKLSGDQWTEIEPSGDGISKNLLVKCLNFDNDGKLWIGTTTNAVFTYDGQSWEHFNWKNSGVIFGKVWDIVTASNGDVWICIERGGTLAKSSSYTSGGAQALGPDPGYEIKQEIAKFDPNGAVIIFKKL